MTTPSPPAHLWRHWLIALVLTAGTLWLLFGRSAPSAPEAPPTAYDRQALAQLLTATMPDSETGEAKTLAAWQGRPLVINFWATWCPPCQRELPDFAEVARRYGTRVQFVGIGLDTREALLEYRERFDLPYPTLVGGGFALGQTVKLGNPTRGLPYTLVLDARGNPVTHHVGAMPRAVLEAAIERALAATP